MNPTDFALIVLGFFALVGVIVAFGGYRQIKKDSQDYGFVE